MANESSWRKGNQDAIQNRPAPNLSRVSTAVRESYNWGRKAAEQQNQGSKSGK